MFRKLRKNEKGFTLVEVIVVAVIVAVLALVGIQLYQGYVVEARRNTAENLAASAASFLQTIVNTRGEDEAEKLTSPLEGPAKWEAELDSLSGNKVSFTCPANASVTWDDTDSSVVAEVNTVTSIGTYKYK